MALPAFLLAPGQVFVPGILGGLGPLAHVQFEREILACGERHGARSDRDHPVWLVANATSTPDRSAALLKNGPSPAPHLAAFTRGLERAGADAIFVVCNTAHAYHAEVQRALTIPWVHLMDIVAAWLRASYPAGTGVGILATDATLRTRLFHRALEAHGLVPVAPDIDSEPQRRVLSAIFDESIGIKATGARVSDEAREHLVSAARWCQAHGATVIVPACTEVSVGLTVDVFQSAPVVDPLTVAADTLLDIAYGRRHPSEFLVSDGPC